MKETYLLGIDCGTTTTKAVIFDLEGREIASSMSKQVKVAHPEPSWAEQEMEEVWQATVTAVRNCLEESRVNPVSIAGASVSGHGGGVWLVDGSGKPVRPAIIWLDGRAGGFISRWEEQGLLPDLYDLSGWNLFAGIGPITIFPWLQENEPESLKRAAVNLTSKDWVKFRLTGKSSTDPSMASIGLLDFQSMNYSEDLLKLTGITPYKHLFPPIISSWETAGFITKEAARLTGLAEGMPVACGAFDGACSTLGSGCYQNGDACSNIATAGVHMILSDKPELDPNRIYSLMCHCVPNMYYKTAMTMVAAGNLDWAEREFCHEERTEAAETGVSVYEIINRKIEKVPVGSGGVLYLPYLQGERAPFVMPEARGNFFGLGDWHTKSHVLRAIFEGVAFSTRHNLEAMSANERLHTLIVTGGGSKSKTWTQIISDCCGTEVVVPAGGDSGSRGAAINAGVAQGVFSSHKDAVEAMVCKERIQQPVEANVEKYTLLFALYKQLIAVLQPVWRELAKVGVEYWSS